MFKLMSTMSSVVEVGSRQVVEMTCGKTSSLTETHGILSKNKTPRKPRWLHGLTFLPLQAS